MKVHLVRVLLFAIVAIIAVGCSDGEPTLRASAGEKSVGVTVWKVQTVTLRRTLFLTGTLLADKEASVSAKIPGRIAEISAEEGQCVNAGEVLVRLEDSEYRVAWKQAKAALPAAEAGLAQARANCRLALLNRKRMEALAKEKSIPQAKLDAAVAQADLAQAQVDAATAQVEQAKAALEGAQVQLDNTKVKAPFDGVVVAKMMHVGENVGPGVPVLRIVDQSRLRLKMNVPEAHFGEVDLGTTVLVQVDGYPGRAFTGKVAKKVPSVDPRSRTFIVEAVLQNPKGLLAEGMFCRAELVFEEKKGALAVPEKAIVRRPGGESVVFVVKRSKAFERLIRTGIQERGFVEILQGLDPGETVVVGGSYGLRSGAPVDIQGEETGVTAASVPAKGAPR